MPVFDPDETVFAWARDGSWLASTEWDGDPSISIWDGETGQQVGTISEDGYEYRILSVSADGRRLATGTYGGELRVIDTSNEHVVWQHSYEEAEPVNALVISSSGDLLVSAQLDEIHVWDFGDGRQLGRLSGHSCDVGHLALSANDGLLVSGDACGQVKIWRVEN